MVESTTYPVHIKITSKLNGEPVKTKRVYHGDGLLEKFLCFMNGDFYLQYPDSRPYLERLGVKIQGISHKDGMYECSFPDGFCVDFNQRSDCGDMFDLIVKRDEKEIIRQFYKNEPNFGVMIGPVEKKDKYLVRECDLSINTED